MLLQHNEHHLEEWAEGLNPDVIESYMIWSVMGGKVNDDQS